MRCRSLVLHMHAPSVLNYLGCALRPSAQHAGLQQAPRHCWPSFARLCAGPIFSLCHASFGASAIRGLIGSAGQGSHRCRLEHQTFKHAVDSPAALGKVLPAIFGCSELTSLQVLRYGRLGPVWAHSQHSQQLQASPILQIKVPGLSRSPPR